MGNRHCVEFLKNLQSHKTNANPPTNRKRRKSTVSTWPTNRPAKRRRHSYTSRPRTQHTVTPQRSATRSDAPRKRKRSPSWQDKRDAKRARHNRIYGDTPATTYTVAPLRSANGHRG